MRSEINFSQVSFLMFGFITGSSILLLAGGGAENAAWLSVIASTLVGVGLILFYVKLSAMNQGRDIIDISILRMGPILGRLVAFGYVWYFFHLAALIARDLSSFATTVSYPNTPQVLIIAVFLIITISLVRNGVEVMAKVAQLLVPLIVAFVFILVVLLLNKVDLNNLKPWLPVPPAVFIKSVFAAVSFPFAEAIVLMMLFPFATIDKKAYKLSAATIIFSGVVLTVVNIISITVLGSITFNSTFPLYQAARGIEVFEFIERVEIISSFTFLVGSMIKLSVCLFGVAVGLTRIFKLSSYQGMVIPVGILIGNLALLVYENLFQLITWSVEIYPYYAFPFQFIFPGLLFALTILRIGKKTA